MVKKIEKGKEVTEEEFENLTSKVQDLLDEVEGVIDDEEENEGEGYGGKKSKYNRRSRQVLFDLIKI